MVSFGAPRSIVPQMLHGRAVQIGRDHVADALISTHRTGAIIRWNHASTALFGYSAEEVLGESVELIIPRTCELRIGPASMLRWQTALRGLRVARHLPALYTRADAGCASR